MSSHIQKSCVGLEATLSDNKKNYGDKVNALLSAWEHVTNFIPAVTPEATQSLIEWVHKHTLRLVLRGEWPKLSPATKTHLGVTLQRCATHLGHHPAASRCTTLISLVHNPWTNPALDSILNGKPDPDREEEFCCNEKGELLTTRLKILCEDRCEDIAVNLAAACVRSLKRNDRLESLCEAQHVQFMMDVYIVLLYKLKRTQDIFSQLKSMDLSEGLELVQRLSGEKLTKYGSARVWRNALKAAELVAQYLVTAGMVRPVDETGAVTLEQIINSWASLHSKLKDITPTLFGMIRKLIEPAESAQHIYIFCSVLGKHFGTGVKPLVIELYVRALTTDMNELESQKVKADKEKVRETARRLSAEFLKLSEVVVDNVGIARECVLTAFSLHPTRNCYDRIREMALACGKIKTAETERRDVLNNFLDTGQEMDTGDGHAGAPALPQSTNALDRGNEAADHAGEAGNLELSRRSDYRKEEILKKLEVTRSRETVGGTDGCVLHPKHDPTSDGRLGDLCFNCGDFKGIDLSRLKAKECSRNVERTLDALILIKGDAVTGSANYDEKSAPSQVLDAEKLGVSPQLCDDLAVVLSSPRYHMLSWVLDWKELNALCEKYLENAEEMRNTNKELKYLNIDYSQFKDWPLDETKDVFFGIEKGYEQWADVPSDNSEEFGSFQPAGPYKRSLTRRSLEDTTDSDSGSMLHTRRPGRHRKIHRLESSESDYDSTERKSKHFRQDSDSVSDSDTNTQDSQTDSLGSDGCRQEKKQTTTSQKAKNLKESKKMRGKSKLTVDAMSHFHMLVNENVRQRSNDEVSSSDMSNDIITLFSADMDENKCETIKGSAYTAEAPLIITEKRSDPAVLKSLRMFRPQNAKKPTRIAQILQKNLLNKSKGNRDAASNHNKKCSPVLTSLNLNPKIILTRTDQVTKKLSPTKKLTPGDITSELINIQKSMPFLPSNNKISNIGGVSPADKHALKGVRSSGVRDSTRPTSVGRTLNSSENLTLSAVKNLSSVKNLGNAKNLSTVKNLGGVKNLSAATKRVYSSHGKSKFDILAKAARDSDILAKSVPGLNTLDMMVPPRVRPTVNIVQLSRNISQSPNPGPPVNSGNTPPRNRDSVIGGNLQLPGTPASSGHDSGVGMSPADQTPPSRSLLHDVGEDVSQPPDTPPCVVGSSMATLSDPGSPKSVRDNRTTKDSPLKDSVSPSSPPSATPTISGVSIPTEQLQIVCKPDGTYQLASVNPQRNAMTLQNFEDRIAPTFPRRAQQRNPNIGTSDASVAASSSPACSSSTSSSVVTMNRNIYDRLTSVKNLTQSGQNSTTGLPKFQQAFGKTIYTLSADTTTVAASTATETLPQLSTAAISPKTTPTTATTNLSKAVQTSVLQNNQPTNTSANVGVQSIANIGNLQLSSGRQILNIVHASDAASTANVATTVASSNPSSLTHLVQNVQGSTPGVIYTHKIPVTISTTNPSQINIIPTISHTASSPVANRAPVVKLNIIRTASTTPIRQQNLSGTIQAVLSAPRIQQTVRHENLISAPIDVPNQVSSTTLEQLREFESVLEQVKERSTVQPQHQVLNAASAAATTTTVQTQTTNQQSKLTSSSALAQQLLVSSQSSAGEFANSSSNAVTFHPEAFPGQKVSLAYVNQTSSPVVSKVMSSSSSTPVVVVTSYCQPAASPALSVTSQSSSSPCVTPAPPSAPSAGKTTPPSSAVAVAAAAAAAAASKSAKKSTTPKTVKTSATNTSKATTIPKPQQKPQEDEQTAQRIYAILDEYAEQLRNSPDLNNKPAPRRRSNPPTNPSQSSKRKKSTSGKSKPTGQQNSELSPSTDDLGRTMGSEDSSSGVVHIQDSPVGLSGPEEVGTPTTTGNLDTSHEIRGLLTNDSDDGVEVNLKRRNLIFADQTSGQPARAVIVQEAGQTTAVSVSEALASGKIGNAAVFVPGTNYILPVNLMKGGQQFTIVSGNSKLLATVPASVRTPNANANTLVLQSFLNQGGKIISQPINQMKQVKLPTLQTLTTGQTISTANASQQNSTMVVAQGNIASQQYLTTESNNEKNSCDAKVDSTASAESATPSTILVNKTSTIGLLQRNLNTAEFGDNQQICGVITSSPNLGLQPTRLFNSSIAKLTVPSNLKNDNVVCLGSATLSQPPEKKFSHDTAQTDKSVAIQTATIALAFAPQSDVSHVNATQKDAKDNSPGNSDKSISPKTIKRKLEDDGGPTCANVVLDSLAKECVTSTFSSASSFALTPSTSRKQSLKNDSPDVDDISSKDVTNIENTGADFLVSTSDGQDTRQSNIENNVDGTSAKVGNGMLCSNARLQEAWEPEHKSTPDTPWRYVPTSTNQLTIEPLKVYTRSDTETLESVHNIVHIMNKNQGMVEMGSSGQLYQTTNSSVPTTTSPTAKKYFMNHTLEPFHQYSNKGMSKSQSNPRLDRELLQQRMERKAAALERELRLQKSLSEECEDLGVDEPSTSDLFPEADLLFDTNHSPSFDHSSQDASCSQPVGGLGIKSYNTGSSYYRPLDSSSSSRDASPSGTDFKVIERRKNAAQRSRAMKDTAKRAKREKLEETGSKSVAKHVRLTLGNCSQDDTSNSNSDVSRLSPANLPSSLDNESQIMNVNSKRSTTITSTGIVTNQQGKVRSRNNSSKESSPGSVLSLPPAMKLDIDLDSLPRITSVNNISAVSSGDESLTLLSGGTADVTMPSPLSPINTGPLLPTHKYTYANKKRSVLKGVTRKEYLSWESPMSDHTQSSSDDEVDEDDEEDEDEEEEEDEDKEDDDDEDEEPEDDEEISVSSIGESLSSQAEESPTNITKASNGLEDNSKSVASNYRAYLSNQDKLKVSARVVLNRSDTKSSLLKRTKNDSGTMSSDKTSEPSDDESSNRHSRHETSSLATNCRARRSSLRGHVKKGCACCNGSPERPKKKSVKLDHKSKKRLGSKQLIKKR